ncbi:hypothetical protein ACKKBG_A27385 [Auxenochlorella protothecoides x Auxenochlorella symbiontica]|uniref:Radial spoke head 10-like protein B n=1 Tax=Auxenochlorella protothecoides TaxID=3075 RepID=A0A1D2A8X3_AUXPR
MVSFKDITDDSSAPLDLAKEVEKLRLQVYMSEMGVAVTPEPNPDMSETIAAGFQSPQDFEVRETSVSYVNGDTYKGEMLGPLRHGKGDHTCSSGDRYVGHWRYDKRDGRGRLVLASGITYEGDWVDDKAQGSGTCTYVDGAVYEGEWREDLREGWGAHIFKGGARYEGEWAADKMHGRGVMVFEDGSTFEGEWQAGERVKGKLAARDGSWEYAGGWKNELQHGSGVLYKHGAFKYMGEWEAGEQCGEGKCLYADGGKYDGEWRAGLRHGKGSYSHGAYKYNGHWVEDRQDGAGMCTNEAGDKYIGMFKAGKQHGKGRCVYADGSKYEGDWEDGQRSGKGVCIYANGDKFQGEWLRDARHGRGVCKFADGTRFKGEWEADAWVQSAAAPSRCRVAGAGVTHATAGVEASFVIQARDEDGNRRLEGGDDFSAALYSPHAVVTGSVRDLGDGSYAVAYVATVAGVYELHVTAGQEHVAASPYPLRVDSGPPCPRRSAATGEGRGRAVTGRPARFSVLLHDAHGNRCGAGAPATGVPLETELTGPGPAPPAVRVAWDEAAGRYDCEYCLTSPGLYRLHLASGGVPLPGAPFSVRCVVAGEDAEVEESRAGPGAQAQDCAGQGLESAARPVQDLTTRWEEIARAAYLLDGDAAGWDSDGEAAVQRTPEDEYIKAHPDVPVVENLEDIWQVSKLQAERKEKEEREKQARLKEIQSKLGETFGEAQRPAPEEIRAAVQEIFAAEARLEAASSTAAQAGGCGPLPPRRPIKLSKAQLHAAAATLDDLDDV